MFKKKSTRLLLAFLAAVTAVLVPAGFASGSGHVVDGIVYIDLETRDGEVRAFDWVETMAPRRNDCRVFGWAGDDLIDISATATPGSGEFPIVPGFRDGDIGTKGPTDPNGEKCARISSPDQILVIELAGELSAWVADAIDFDMELKQGGTFEVTYVNTFTGDALASGPIDLAGDSDDGPDSADGDNYRFFDVPGVEFNRVEIRAVTGLVSLDGGADGTANANAAMDPNDNSSQIRLNREAVIDCEDTVTFGGEPDALAEITLEAQNLSSGWSDDATQCPEKFWEGDTDPTTVTFIPSISSGIAARYSFVLTFYGQQVTTDGTGAITSLGLNYDPDADGPLLPRPLKPCLQDPTAAGFSWTGTPLDLIPAGESACFYSADVTITGTTGGITYGTEVYRGAFLDDPIFQTI